MPETGPSKEFLASALSRSADRDRRVEQNIGYGVLKGWVHVIPGRGLFVKGRGPCTGFCASQWIEHLRSDEGFRLETVFPEHHHTWGRL